MRVLLVRPAAPNRLSFTNILDSEPLELEYLHTGLKAAGIEDMICDYLVQNEPFLTVLKKYRPQVVAVTGYNKGTRQEYNKEAVRIINSTTAQCIGLMIVGISAKKKDFDELYDWIVANDLWHVIISIFTPIPGTPLFEEYKDRLITNKIEHWDFLHLVVKPEHISVRQFYLYYHALFLKLYTRARKKGLYSFLNLKYYRQLLSRFLLRKAYLDR